MLIATTNIDIDKCFELKSDADKLHEYVMSIIPDKYKHVSAIIGNQKYYINCMMFKSRFHSIEEKRELSNTLMIHSKVAGVMNTFVTVSELEVLVDRDMVEEYRKENIV